MFVQTWNKYLPVIRILLKRSVNADQTLDMNQSDFQRAAGGKKVKFTFSIMLMNGRFRGTESPSPLANDLISTLQQDNTASEFLGGKELQFTMNNNFQLLIKNNTPVTEPKSQPGEEITDDQEDTSSPEAVPGNA